jgi:hypothetical protein
MSRLARRLSEAVAKENNHLDNLGLTPFKSFTQRLKTPWTSPSTKLGVESLKSRLRALRF